MEKKPAGIVTAREIEDKSESFSHPWNERSEIRGARISQLAGLTRTGVSRVSVAPGRESFAYHDHHCEEEWIYILSGRAVIEIDGVETELGSGDFVGFPTPSVPHQLSNPFDEPVEYLMGGESKDVEIADFPRLNRRMIRRGQDIAIFDIDSARPFKNE